MPGGTASKLGGVAKRPFGYKNFGFWESLKSRKGRTVCSPLGERCSCAAVVQRGRTWLLFTGGGGLLLYIGEDPQFYGVNWSLVRSGADPMEFKAFVALEMGHILFGNACSQLLL